MSWSSKYVGTPFADLGRTRAGCDCYGLVKIVYQEELSITLPDYLGYACSHEQGEIAALIAGAERLPMWVPVTDDPVAFDVTVFRRGRLQSHVGLVIRRRLMLHMAAEDCAKVERYDNGQWKHRLTGLWRHAAQGGPVDVVGVRA